MFWTCFSLLFHCFSGPSQRPSAFWGSGERPDAIIRPNSLENLHCQFSIFGPAVCSHKELSKTRQVHNREVQTAIFGPSILSTWSLIVIGSACQRGRWFARLMGSIPLEGYPKKKEIWRPVFTKRWDCLGVALRANDTDRQPGIFIAKTLNAGKILILWFPVVALLFVRKMLANIPNTNPIQASRPEQNGAIEDSDCTNNLATISRSRAANSLSSPISDIRSLEKRNNTNKHMWIHTISTTCKGIQMYYIMCIYIYIYTYIFNWYNESVSSHRIVGSVLHGQKMPKASLNKILLPSPALGCSQVCDPGLCCAGRI